jgi:hypothetical protein
MNIRSMNYTLLVSAILFSIILTSCQLNRNPRITPGSVSTDGEVPGPVCLHGGNPRYLEYKGSPVILITSAEHYGALINLDFDYRVYLETLAGEGFNYTRIFAGPYLEPTNNIFGIQRNTLAPQPGRYLAPWVREEGKYNLDRFNPDYFSRLKDFVSFAEKQGIIVEVTLFSSIYQDNAWALCPFNMENNANGTGKVGFRKVNTMDNGGLLKYQEAFTRRMVRELNGFDNFFFEIQNEPWADNGMLAEVVKQDEKIFSSTWQQKVEVANEEALCWQENIAMTIRDEEAGLEKKHLIAQNICNFQYELEAKPEEVSILNFHYALPAAVISNLDLGGVIGLDETGFMPHEDSLYIDQAWRIILSGAGLYNNLDYSFIAGREAGDWPIPGSNPGWGGQVYRKKLGILVETVNSVPFHDMEYSGSIIKQGNPGLKQHGLRKEEAFYLVFLEGLDGSALVPGLPSGTYRVTWINVDSGEKQSGFYSPGNGASIVPPFPSTRAALLIRPESPNP